MGAWEAMLGRYVVHFGPWRDHVADLGSHLVAKRAAESRHEQPETEKCRFLVDVAQKLSNKFWRNCSVEAALRPFSGRGKPSEGSSGPSWGLSWGFGRPCWEVVWCILGLGRVMLQILEAILWPRGLPRANMNSQKQRSAEPSLKSHKSCRTSSGEIVLWRQF